MYGFSTAYPGSFADRLPIAAQRYLGRLGEIVGVPVHMISTGADRQHNIILQHPFD